MPQPHDMPRRIHAMAEPVQPEEEFIVIEAASSTRARVTGVAYAGGPMRIAGWNAPVVVDLSGLQLPENVPLLANHENRTSSRIGLVTARVEGNALVIEGEILSSSGLAQGIVEQARAGAEWQLSIGADVKASQLVTGQKLVNGRVQTGPFHHVVKSVLREVSVVAVGADASTKMKLAARFTLYGGLNMDFDKWLKDHSIDAAALNEEQKTKLQAAFDAGQEPPQEVLDALKDGNKTSKKIKAGGPAPAPKPEPEPKQEPVSEPKPEDPKVVAENVLKAERERIAAIKKLCGGEFKEIEDEAISAGWSVADTSPKILEALRKSRPAAPAIVGSHVHRNEVKVLEAAMCLRAGIDEKAVLAAYGEPVIEAAYLERSISIQELIIACAQLEGVTIPRSFGNETIRAAFSTVSLPGILNNTANKRMLKSFEAQPIVALKLCAQGDLNDFKESERYRITDVGDITQVGADGELKHGGVTEHKATNQLGTFGKMFALTRQMIFNDDLGAFLKVPSAMGAKAAQKIDQLFFTRLLANPTQLDGYTLFGADHGNYQEGAATALSGAAITAARVLFARQTDSGGSPINVMPKYLLVPPELQDDASAHLNSRWLMEVGSTSKTRIPSYNPIADANLELVMSPYLSNASYTGYSTTAWYLFADPNQVDTFEVGYLKGKRTPTVEQGETDFNTLGIQFRVYFDLGVREQDHRGMVKSKGAA